MGNQISDPKLFRWENVERMNLYQIEEFLQHECGRTIGWLANTINVPGLSNAKAKLLGLARLAAVGMVTDSGYEMYYVNINGYVKPMVELELYSKGLELIPEEHLQQWLEEGHLNLWAVKMVEKAIRYHAESKIFWEENGQEQSA